MNRTADNSSLVRASTSTSAGDAHAIGQQFQVEAERPSTVSALADKCRDMVPGGQDVEVVSTKNSTTSATPARTPRSNNRFPRCFSCLSHCSVQYDHDLAGRRRATAHYRYDPNITWPPKWPPS